MDYEEGFYIAVSKISGEVTVAQLEDSVWYMVGCSEQLLESDFTTIGEKIDVMGTVPA